MEVSSAQRSVLVRSARVKARKPSGLPRGQRRVVELPKINAVWCGRVGLQAMRVGRMRVRRACKVCRDVLSFGLNAARPNRVYPCASCSTSMFVCATDGPSLLDFGSRLGRWHKKCLQRAVLGLCGESGRGALKARLLRVCSNNRGSGLAGGVLEANNFRSVAKILRCFGKRVRVLDVRCAADFWEGLFLGAWTLGSDRGQTLGTLVWSRADQHVFVADGVDVQAWLGQWDSRDGLGCPPWSVCNVGAPRKKRGFRGGDAVAIGKKGLATRYSVSSDAGLGAEEDAEIVGQSSAYAGASDRGEAQAAGELEGVGEPAVAAASSSADRTSDTARCDAPVDTRFRFGRSSGASRAVRARVDHADRDGEIDVEIGAESEVLGEG